MGRIILGRDPTTAERAAGDVGAGENPDAPSRKAPDAPIRLGGSSSRDDDEPIRLGGETIHRTTEPRGVIGTITDFTDRFDVQKVLEKSGSNIRVAQLIYTGPVIGGGSLIGKHIPDSKIAEAVRAAGFTGKRAKDIAGQIRFNIGSARVREITQTLTNPKNQALIMKVLKKLFSTKALILAGSLAGTIGLGKWAQKEAAEPITFAMRDVLREAQNTGDYTLYWESAAARDELTDMSKWEQILAWTPIISPFITIPRAIKGVIQGGKILDEVARQAEIALATGESEDEKWARIEVERKASKEAERIADEAYYKQVQKDIENAKAEAREEDERYWAKVLREREEFEKVKREAEELYWADVRRANDRLRVEEQNSYEDYGRSNLDFGLL